MLEQVGVGHLDTSVRSYRRATVQNGWVRSFIILVEFGFSSNTLKAESSEWSGKLDLRHSKEDGDAQHRPELDDDSETLTSGESESPEAHRAQVILFEQSEGSGALVEPEQRSEIAPALVTRVPLSEELRNAEARTADPKLQKRLTAVVRYTRYFD